MKIPEKILVIRQISYVWKQKKVNDVISLRLYTNAVSLTQCAFVFNHILGTMQLALTSDFMFLSELCIYRPMAFTFTFEQTWKSKFAFNNIGMADITGTSTTAFILSRQYSNLWQSPVNTLQTVLILFTASTANITLVFIFVSRADFVIRPTFSMLNTSKSSSLRIT